jgi:hypothetical protein
MLLRRYCGKESIRFSGRYGLEELVAREPRGVMMFIVERVRV